MLDKRISALEDMHGRRQAKDCGTCRGLGMVIYEITPQGHPPPADLTKCPECGARVGCKILKGVSMDDL